MSNEMFWKVLANWVEQDRKQEEKYKNEIELLNDDIKQFVIEEMYPVIKNYNSCLATAEDYDNIDTLKKDWFDFIRDYYKD